MISKTSWSPSMDPYRMLEEQNETKYYFDDKLIKTNSIDLINTAYDNWPVTSSASIPLVKVINNKPFVYQGEKVTVMPNTIIYKSGYIVSTNPTIYYLTEAQVRFAMFNNLMDLNFHDILRYYVNCPFGDRCVVITNQSVPSLIYTEIGSVVLPRYLENYLLYETSKRYDIAGIGSQALMLIDDSELSDINDELWELIKQTYMFDTDAALNRLNEVCVKFMLPATKLRAFLVHLYKYKFTGIAKDIYDYVFENNALLYQPITTINSTDRILNMMFRLDAENKFTELGITYDEAIKSMFSDIILSGNLSGFSVSYYIHVKFQSKPIEITNNKIQVQVSQSTDSAINYAIDLSVSNIPESQVRVTEFNLLDAKNIYSLNARNNYNDNNLIQVSNVVSLLAAYPGIDSEFMNFLVDGNHVNGMRELLKRSSQKYLDIFFRQYTNVNTDLFKVAVDVAFDRQMKPLSFEMEYLNYSFDNDTDEIKNLDVNVLSGCLSMLADEVENSCSRPIGTCLERHVFGLEIPHSSVVNVNYTKDSVMHFHSVPKTQYTSVDYDTNTNEVVLRDGTVIVDGNGIYESINDTGINVGINPGPKFKCKYTYLSGNQTEEVMLGADLNGINGTRLRLKHLNGIRYLKPSSYSYMGLIAATMKQNRPDTHFTLIGSSGCVNVADTNKLPTYNVISMMWREILPMWYCSHTATESFNMQDLDSCALITSRFKGAYNIYGSNYYFRYPNRSPFQDFSSQNTNTIAVTMDDNINKANVKYPILKPEISRFEMRGQNTLYVIINNSSWWHLFGKALRPNADGNSMFGSVPNTAYGLYKGTRVKSDNLRTVCLSHNLTFDGFSPGTLFNDLNLNTVHRGRIVSDYKAIVDGIATDTLLSNTAMQIGILSYPYRYLTVDNTDYIMFPPDYYHAINGVTDDNNPMIKRQNNQTVNINVNNNTVNFAFRKYVFERCSSEWFSDYNVKYTDETKVNSKLLKRKDLCPIDITNWRHSATIYECYNDLPNLYELSKHPRRSAVASNEILYVLGMKENMGVWSDTSEILDNTLIWYPDI